MSAKHYTPFDVAQPYVHKESQPVLNKAFAYIYDRLVFEGPGLTLLQPDPDDPQFVGKLAELVIPQKTGQALIPGAGKPSPSYLSSHLLACISTWVMLSPWYSTRSKEGREMAPAYDEWYKAHLEYYSQWKPNHVRDLILKKLQEFYTKFPPPKKPSRRSTGTAGAAAVAEALGSTPAHNPALENDMPWERDDD